MRLDTRHILVAVGGMLLASGVAAGPPQGLGSVPPAAMQHSAAFSDWASALLTEIQKEAVGLRRNAETLRTFARGQFSWQSHAEYLRRVKDHINAVGERTAELQRIRSSVLPWQQQAINEVTSHAAQVAASTQAAIVQLNNNRDSRFVSEYRDNLTTIADSSADMKETVDKFLEYEKAQQKLLQLREELELKGDTSGG